MLYGIMYTSQYIMSDIHSEQYWDRFWDDYPEQLSKDLEDRKIEYRLDLMARELDYVEPSVPRQ
jgi:hypothetical protein